MARRVLYDEGGHLARFFRLAPKAVKEELKYAVGETSQGVQQRMRASAPHGPDAPHIADDVERSRPRISKRGVAASVGYITPKKAAPDSDATQASVALFNEYRPNKQPFMRSSTDDEASEFVSSVKDAMNRLARSFTIGTSAGRPTSGGSGSGGLL